MYRSINSVFYVTGRDYVFSEKLLLDNGIKDTDFPVSNKALDRVREKVTVEQEFISMK